MADEPTVDDFLSTYSASVQQIAKAARALLLERVPGASETLDAKARVIGYGYGPGYSDTVFVLILSRTGVKVGIPEGASLPDPEQLLRGKGWRHRHVPLTTAALIQSPAMQSLLASALHAYHDRRTSNP